MSPRAFATVVVLFLVGLTGCGGGEDSASKMTIETTTAGPTTTAATEESLRAGICSLDISAAPEADTAARYTYVADAYAKLVPPPSLKGALDELVATFRAGAALWSDASPTTVEDWSKRMEDLKTRSQAANKAVEGPCPPTSATTTTVAGPPKAAYSVGAVGHEQTNRGLYWFVAFSCPEGKQIKLAEGMEKAEQEGVGTVYDAEAGAASPFTGVIANQSWGRVYKKVGASCV